QQVLAIIAEESQRLSRMINQVLDLSKIEAGEMAFQLEPLDLADVVTHAVGANRSLFEARGIALLVDCHTEPVPVVADRDKLIQVVTNLLSNAAKFTPAGGRVQVRTYRPGDGSNLAIVEVEDSGVGIPPDQADAVFEKFRQVGDPLTAKPEGT